MPKATLFQTLLEHAPLSDEAQQWLQVAIEPAHFKYSRPVPPGVYTQLCLLQNCCS